MVETATITAHTDIGPVQVRVSAEGQFPVTWPDHYTEEQAMAAYQRWVNSHAVEMASALGRAAGETRVGGMDFGDALRALQAGHRVARAGWTGRGMWLSYSPGSKALPAENFWSKANREYATAIGGNAEVLPCITMKTATGEILMGWLASQTDMLAHDWEILDDGAAPVPTGGPVGAEPALA